VEVPEPGSAYYLPQDVPHGQVREVCYNSKVTGGWRHALVPCRSCCRFLGRLKPAHAVCELAYAECESVLMHSVEN
jgi:hypothetical protein